MPRVDQLAAQSPATITALKDALGVPVSVLDFIPASEHAAILGRTSTYDCSDGLAAALTYAIDNKRPLHQPAGLYPLANPVVATFALNSTSGLIWRGGGRGCTTMTYSGSGNAIEFVASGYALNLDIGGFEVNCTGAPADTVGVRVNPGIWRSSFADIYIHRDQEATPSGRGLYVGGATGAGCFDLKLCGLYITGFAQQIRGEGSSLSGNTITNLSLSDSYLSGGVTPLYATYGQGWSIQGTQTELASDAGMEFNECGSVFIVGGTVESPNTGARGIVCSGGTDGVVALCEFFNNDGGNFINNGAIGNFYKTGQSGLIAAPGSELRIDRDASYAAVLRFLLNGTADVRLRVADTGNAMAITNSAGSEKYKFDVANGILELLSATGFLRLRDNAYLQFFQGGAAVSGVYAGTGSPEGVQTAPVASLYLNRGAGGGAVVYVKASGSGNTGWLPMGIIRSGATASRPSGPVVGTSYFDTTLGKPVWFKTGTTWVDATGATA